MMATAHKDGSDQAGFTLIEALAAMALMGLIVSAIATITSQWLPGWNRGFGQIQRSEAVGIALDRISADIAAAEFMRSSRDAKTVVFDGTESSVTFARTSLGPNAAQGLDVVRIGEAVDRDAAVLARSRAAFVPGVAPNFADPVILLRAPYQISFSYAGTDRNWKNAWRDAQALPSAVLMTLRDTTAERAVTISRVAVVRISESAESRCARVEEGCGVRPASADGEVRAASGGARR